MKLIQTSLETLTLIAQLMEVVHRILEDIWETVHGAFRAFDPNKTGFIRVNGLQRVVK